MAALGTAPRVSDRAASHPEKSIKSAVAFTEAACEGVRPACRLKHRRARSHHSSMDSFRVRIVTSECGNDRANLWIDSANAGQDAGQEAEVDDADLVDKVDRLDSHTADAGRRFPQHMSEGYEGVMRNWCGRREWSKTAVRVSIVRTDTCTTLAWAGLTHFHKSLTINRYVCAYTQAAFDFSHVLRP